MGRAKARKGNLLFTLDLMYVNLGEEDTTPRGLETDVTSELLIVEFGREGGTVMSPRRTVRLSLSTQVLLGLILGLGVGVFFGEHVAFLQHVGKAFMLLLQMTVLPYLALSLITGLGQLTYQEVKALGLKVGAVLLGSWGLAFIAILVMPLAFPIWESATFFSTSLVEKPEEVNFLSLFIPANPFNSFANNVVPAVVFSVAMGLALIGMGQKDGLLAPSPC